MPELEILDEIQDNDGQTEILLNQPPSTIEQILDEEATVVVKSTYNSSYEYVILDDDFSEPITFTFCETDDEKSITTDYDLNDFVQSEDEEIEQDSINTLVFSQFPSQELSEVFNKL